ncbi:MAG: hypothetical protein HYT83_01925 [Candidatus Levybacteria bacterium]|nr:hypothetical protein [Candidatus Levybacteria bacterium]
MKAEKIVISFIAVLIGVLVAGAAFYFYQSTKIVSPSQIKTVSIKSPTPTPSSSIFLSVENPKNEDVVDTKTITVNGKTTSDAVIILSTISDDQVFTPTKIGSFSTTTTLNDGANLITITAIAPNGEEVKITKTVTYSTESF